jgi:hypothetical protein
VSVDASRDLAHRSLYIVNQNNSEIEVMDRRAGTMVAHFGGMDTSQANSINRTGLPSTRKAPCASQRIEAGGSSAS